MQPIIKNIRTLLQQSADSSPENVARFFKVGPGSYSEHDQFMGIKVATLRKIAKGFLHLNLDEIEQILKSPFNEERLFALIVLTHQYAAAPVNVREDIYHFYVKNRHAINNWNLVDSSAHLIVGAHLFDKDRTYLMELARSSHMWDRRISIVSTWYFIRQNDLAWTFELAKVLLKDSHDLIHKSVGWMLREAGKKDQPQLVDFLNHFAPKMPRTMLRYAIEKFPKEQQQLYLKGMAKI